MMIMLKPSHVSSSFKKTVTKEQALQKLKAYCAYQERCHQEVKEKLITLGIYNKDADEIMAVLIEENYLNEERFAVQYAGGKFRINHWGRAKIKYALKLKQVSEYCIKKAVSLIDEDTYLRLLQKLASEKERTLKGDKNQMLKLRKVYDYLLTKGFEPDLINRVLEGLK